MRVKNTEDKAPKYVLVILRERMKEADIDEPVPANVSLCEAMERLIAAMPN